MKKSIRGFCFQAICSMICICICILCFSMCNLYADSEDLANMRTTLLAKDANGNEIGSLTGSITDGSKLVMENDPSKLGYAEICRTYVSTANEVFTYGVQITDGNCDGAADLVFKIGNQYNGMTAKIISRSNGLSDSDPVAYDEHDVIVTDGSVQVSVSYDFTIRTPFVIGVYTSVVPENKDKQSIDKPLLEQKTLVDKRASSVQITGQFSDDAMISINKNDNRFKKLLENSDDNFIAGYEVKLTAGRYEGKVNVSISLGTTYANKKVQVGQLLEDGKLLTEENVSSATGDVTFEVDELSPIIITERKPDSKKESSVDFNSIIFYVGGAAVLVLVITAGIVYKKKK